MGLLPEFVETGLGDAILPDGIHPATVEAIEKRFVDEFPKSLTRARLFRGWLSFSVQVRALVRVEHEYIDGSFVTAAPNPKDVDASYWIPRRAVEGLEPRDQQAFGGLWERRLTSYHVDGYLVMRCPRSHRGRQEYEYWKHRTETAWPRYRKWNREFVDSPRKGYVEVQP